ncbi:hypothetical protein CsSME_00041634 [Camellia sinensis var. sinensis]
MEEVKGSDAKAEKDGGALKFDVNSNSADLMPISLQGYLVLVDLTVGQFVYVVWKRIKLGAEKAIFIFVKNILPPTAAMMSAIYEENKDEDGFLYMTYSSENTFGSI